MQCLPMFSTQPSCYLFYLWNAKNTFFLGQVVTFTFTSLQERKPQSHPACHPSTMWRKIAPSLFSARLLARSLNRGILPFVCYKFNFWWSKYDRTKLTVERVVDQFLIYQSKETVLSRPASLSHYLILPTDSRSRKTSNKLKSQSPKDFSPIAFLKPHLECPRSWK